MAIEAIHGAEGRRIYGADPGGEAGSSGEGGDAGFLALLDALLVGLPEGEASVFGDVLTDSADPAEGEADVDLTALVDTIAAQLEQGREAADPAFDESGLSAEARAALEELLAGARARLSAREAPLSEPVEGRRASVEVPLPAESFEEHREERSGATMPLERGGERAANAAPPVAPPPLHARAPQPRGVEPAAEPRATGQPDPARPEVQRAAVELARSEPEARSTQSTPGTSGTGRAGGLETPPPQTPEGGGGQGEGRELAGDGERGARQPRDGRSTFGQRPAEGASASRPESSASGDVLATAEPAPGLAGASEGAAPLSDAFEAVQSAPAAPGPAEGAGRGLDLPPDAALHSLETAADRAPRSADGPAQSAAPARPPTPPDSIPAHVEWLVARGGGSVRLRLHPPELGEIDLRVSVRGNDVQVVMSAQEGAARIAAAEQRDLLGQSLAQRDLNMEQFEIRGGREEGETGARQGGDGRSAGQGSPAATAGGRADAASSSVVLPPIRQPQDASPTTS